MSKIYSKRDREGLLLFIPIMIILALIVINNRESPTYRADIEDIRDYMEERNDSTTLFNFDPNSASLSELRELGLTQYMAVSIIRYRKSGKVFRIKEDLYTCYGMTDSVYYAIEPYISIGQEYKYKARAFRDSTTQFKREKPHYIALSQFLIDTVGVQYLRATGALTKRQAEVFVRWRDLSGIRDMEELRACYVVSDSIASMLEPFVIFPTETPTSELTVEPLNINLADSAQLDSLYGIGAKSARDIVEYRKKLGGFYCAEQLSEVKTVTESNYEKILQQISCDSCDISKIDVNFASSKSLMNHPYITNRALRRLLKLRQLKGGWSRIEEMIEDNIFTQQEATRLRPYFDFR